MIIPHEAFALALCQTVSPAAEAAIRESANNVRTEELSKLVLWLIIINGLGVVVNFAYLLFNSWLQRKHEAKQAEEARNHQTEIAEDRARSRAHAEQRQADRKAIDHLASIFADRPGEIRGDRTLAAKFLGNVPAFIPSKNVTPPWIGAQTLQGCQDAASAMLHAALLGTMAHSATIKQTAQRLAQALSEWLVFAVRTDKGVEIGPKNEAVRAAISAVGKLTSEGDHRP